jgi:hypothetical protein
MNLVSSAYSYTLVAPVSHRLCREKGATPVANSACAEGAHYGLWCRNELAWSVLLVWVCFKALIWVKSNWY